jgi:murein L,D-transpeptidase YafK
MLYKTYDICQLSGKLGPKRREGDLQVPEGYYEVSEFNYHSKYLLSLGINYPNKSDKILSPYSNKGGSIYIHGNCVSIGCISMGNDNIKEIFGMCETARDKGQKHIYVHIFPTNFNDQNKVDALNNIIKNNPNIVKFENNIKKGFYLFEKTKIPPLINVDSINGQYLYP